MTLSLGVARSISERSLDVLIKPESQGRVSATVLGWPEYRAEGDDRQSALSALQRLLDEQLAQADIVTFELKPSQPENPWVAMAGEFKDDPLFDAMLADIEDYRCAADEAVYSQIRSIASDVIAAPDEEVDIVAIAAVDVNSIRSVP